MSIKKTSYSSELASKYGRIAFGQFLTSWRKCEDMSQADFARFLSLSPANLCDLEQGRRIPSPTRVKAISRKLGIPERGLIAMALQDSLLKDGFRYQVELKEAA